MRRRSIGQWSLVAAITLALMGLGGAAYADPLDLSIFDVQYTPEADGISPYNGQTHNVLGGVVTHIKPWGGKKRVYIQDPDSPTWGGILVKDWTTGGDLALNVSVGDRIDLSMIYVEESSGTTTLQFGGEYSLDASFTPQGTAPVPDALSLTAGELAAPVYDPVEDTWFVENYYSESYEGMLVMLTDVAVGTLDMGKADDNYQLLEDGDIAWASDFMNWDAGGTYHERIWTTAELESITGIVEQYVGETDDGTRWDYYQMFTRTTADIVPEPWSAGLLLSGFLLTVARRRRSGPAAG